MEAPVRVVHVVAKTHLDLGFTALAAEVEDRYLTEFFPRAIEVAAQLRTMGDAQLTWTTGSWILHRALGDPDARRAAAVAAAVERGDLAWHALPLTFHTELMDVGLLRNALGISAELDDRFGRQTTAAKMTDVPGHTRSLVPSLAEAGVTFLHIGVNPAWPVPDVPPVFRWRAPDGAEVTVAYQAGGYGGEVSVPGCDEVLVFLHAGDNLGPPTATEVQAVHTELRARYPEAVVRASTLDAFARALVGSGAVAGLPVVTSEIGDPWLFGAGSDPQKVAVFREVLRGATRTVAADRRAMLVAEHTWGLDQKVVLPTEARWDAAALDDLRRSAVGQRFERSWAEQRAYLDDVHHRFAPATTPTPVPATPYLAIDLADPGAQRPGSADGWELRFDPVTGALAHLVHGGSGRLVANADHPLGLLRRQTFDEAAYERFYAGLTPSIEDEWWARRDNTKPGIDEAGARSGFEAAEVTGAWAAQVDDQWLSTIVQVGLADRTAWLEWRWSGGQGAALDLRVWWDDKAATRLPEATWLSFVPLVEEPQRWTIDKLGQAVDPTDVVRHGGRSLHGLAPDVDAAVRYRGSGEPFELRSPDAPLLAPGRPNLLDTDPPVPDLAGGWHVLLHDNCWGTNFPMWNEGPAHFGFTITLGR